MGNEGGEFEPRIVAFLCNWCTYTGADLAGTSRIQYPPNVRVIRLMCSGQLDPIYVARRCWRGPTVSSSAAATPAIAITSPATIRPAGASPSSTRCSSNWASTLTGSGCAGSAPPRGNTLPTR